MDYRAIGIHSGNPATGLDIIFATFREQAGLWTCEQQYTAHFAYPEEWKERLSNAGSLPAPAYISLHNEYGQYAGQLVNRFIAENQLHYKVALIAFSGHPVFSDEAGHPVCAGNGAEVAAAARIPVISDFFAIDKALGGSWSHWGAIKEKLGMAHEQPGQGPALYYAFMGVLRWRHEYNVFAADTRASANSIGGAFWNGEEA